MKMKRDMITPFRFTCMVLMCFFTSPFLLAQKTWTLEECIQFANEHNLQIQQVEYGSKVNEAYLKQSKAQRLPSLNAGANSNFVRGRTFDLFTLQQLNGGYYSSNFSSSLSMPLYKGGSIQNSIRQNNLQVEAGDLDVDANKESLSLMIAQTYLQILQLEEQVKNSNNQIESSAEQLKNTEARFEKGLVAENFVLQQEAQLANEKWQLQQNVNALKNAKITLLQLMEKPVSDDFEIEKPNLELVEAVNPYASPADIYKTSLAIRPQVKRAQLETESSVIEVEVARGEQFPSLNMFADLNSNYSSARQEVNYISSSQVVPVGYLASDPTEFVLNKTLITTPQVSNYQFLNQLDDNLSFSVGLSLSIPILSNRLYRTRIEVAKINSELAKLSERGISNQLRKDIELAYSDLTNSIDQFNAAKKQYGFAVRTFENAEYQYSSGLISPTDFFIEKNNFANAQNNFVLAKYQYLFSRMIVNFYSGNKLEIN